MINPSQNKLIKISNPNRRLFIRLSLCFSLLTCFGAILSSTTNNWIYTSEVLKYYVFPNQSYQIETISFIEPTYFKNATMGPWIVCWNDPITPFHCQHMKYFSDEGSPDMTTGVSNATRKSTFFLLLSALLDGFGLVCILICSVHQNPFKSLLIAGLVHILAGISTFACIIVYMSSVSSEVGNKIHAATMMDDPLFIYKYGFSFISFETSFLSTELAAVLVLIVYMAKRDERMYNRLCIYGMINKNNSDDIHTIANDQSMQHDRYYEHSRFHTLQKSQRSMSTDMSDGAKKHPLVLVTLEDNPRSMRTSENNEKYRKSRKKSTPILPGVEQINGKQVDRSPFRTRSVEIEIDKSPISSSFANFCRPVQEETVQYSQTVP